MTFVLNILSKDYSLIAADRKGTSHGPIEMKVGSLSISIPQGGVIDGVNKLRVNEVRNCVVGIAGTLEAHAYIDEFQKCSEGRQAVRTITAWLERQLAVENLEDYLTDAPTMEHQLIATFFDETSGAFYSCLHLFTRFRTYTNIDARFQNPQPMLLHVGSGSGNFEKAVGLDAINAFLNRLREGLSVEERLEWIANAFRAVSEIDDGVGVDFEAVMATRETRTFETVKAPKGGIQVSSLVSSKQ